MPGCVFLKTALFVKWPQHRGDAGCYLHNGKTDSGRPSFHSRGRAIDIWIATGHLDVGTQMFDWCHANRNEIGLNEVIFNSRIWRADNLSAGIHAYTANRHQDHIHIALNLDGARAQLPFYTPHPNPPPAPLVVVPKGNATMQTVLYPAQNQIHSFWIDKGGRVRHAWNSPGQPAAGSEKMNSLTETFLPDRGLSVYTDQLTLDLVCRGVVADGACGEFRWPAGTKGPWGFRVIGRA